jgi:hypothetical protein
MEDKEGVAIDAVETKEAGELQPALRGLHPHAIMPARAGKLRT